MIPSLENLKELEILIRFDCSLTNMSEITLNIFMKILENLEIENITLTTYYKYEPDWTNSDRYGKYGPNCWTMDQTNLIRTDWVGTKIWVGSNKIRTKISDRNPVPIRTGTVIWYDHVLCTLWFTLRTGLIKNKLRLGVSWVSWFKIRLPRDYPCGWRWPWGCSE